MSRHDRLVGTYLHLDNLWRADEALHTLRRIASLVKPVMRAHGWRIGQLAEFYPQEANLLGLNWDRGAKICLRLRYAYDINQFLPLEQVIDTMLHELCHIVHGPHHAGFHALWGQLRSELQDLMMRGYTGEGFLSEGHRLGARPGGARIQELEAGRLVRVAAEQRRRQARTAVLGRPLGGVGPPPGQDMRRVIAGAAESRNRATRGCASETLSQQQMQDVVDTTSRNGRLTQAEQDEANEVAIAQALWELMRDEDDEGRGARQPASSGSWNCKWCTLQNPEQYLCCDACATERSSTLFIDLTDD